LLDRAARIQCLTRREVEQVRARGVRAPCVVIPNGVWCRDATARTGGKARALLFLGRLHPKKGLDLLIQAFAGLASEHPDVRLVIAGDDGGSGYGRQVRHMAERTGLPVASGEGAGQDGRARICFVGEVRGEQKEAWLARSHAFLLASYSEGLPVAVLEAMAHALPVVVTDACNVPEVADAGAGFVVAPDAGRLAEGIARLLTDDALRARCAANARRLVEERFAWPVVVDRLMAVYEQVGMRP
jgi:poly(glycerol-phosphate) alpha-glucosyltransferase